MGSADLGMFFLKYAMNFCVPVNQGGRPRKTLKKGVTGRVKNKGSQAHKKGRKRPKYQTTCPLHPETMNNISDAETHANHVFFSAIKLNQCPIPHKYHNLDNVV